MKSPISGLPMIKVPGGWRDPKCGAFMADPTTEAPKQEEAPVIEASDDFPEEATEDNEESSEEEDLDEDIDNEDEE